MNTDTLEMKGKPAVRPGNSFYRRHEALILGTSSVAVVIAIWEAFWLAGMISPLFFSGPSAIAQRFHVLWNTGALQSDIIYSGSNFIIGFVLALFAGVVVGVLLGWYRQIRLTLDPFINAFYATPRIALIPLIIIWFGIGMWSGIFIIFLSAFMPILVNTVIGIRTTDRDLLRAARSFCASDWQIFKTVAVPGSVPFILTGVRQGIAHGLIGVVVGEMFGASEGVGFMIAYGGQTFATDTLFVGVIIVAGTGILLTSITERLQQHFSRWMPEDR